MNLPRVLARLRRSSEGSAAIEFAILSPVLIMMMFGILAIGLYMQSFNALRAVAYDIERYTVVEYQKANEITTTQVEEVSYAIARRPQYNLKASRIDATVVEQSTGVTGAKRYRLTLSYTPPEILGIRGLAPPTMTKVQSIIVPD